MPQDPQVPAVRHAFGNRVGIGQADPVDHEARIGVVAVEAADVDLGHRGDVIGTQEVDESTQMPGLGGHVLADPAADAVEQLQTGQFVQASQGENLAARRLADPPRPDF